MSRAEHFEPLPIDQAERWARFGHWSRPYFPNLLGLVVEDIRQDYCRMRLPFRPELEQPAGVVHGGAVAALLDAVVVPAIGSAYGPEATFTTVDLHVQYLGALRGEDAVAEGWIVRRGRSVVFCEAEAIAEPSGIRVARSLLTYHVRS